MPRFLPALTIVTLLHIASPALAADEFVTISDEAAFLALVDGRELRLGMLGVSVEVLADGTITGSAAGWDLTGNWTWQDGFFCRDIDWSGTKIDYNCQLVEVRGSEAMRFTVDQGAGQAAEFNLR